MKLRVLVKFQISKPGAFISQPGTISSRNTTLGLGRSQRFFQLPTALEMRLAIMPLGQQPNGGHNDPKSDEDDVTTINGIEHAVPLRSRHREPSTEVVRQGHRHHGKLRANKTLWEEWANKPTPMKTSDWMVKVLEKQADGRLRRTYMEGVPLNDVEESAITLNVGLTFLAGADKPQVNRLEEQSMTSKQPNYSRVY